MSAGSVDEAGLTPWEELTTSVRRIIMRALTKATGQGHVDEPYAVWTSSGAAPDGPPTFVCSDRDYLTAFDLEVDKNMNVLMVVDVSHTIDSKRGTNGRYVRVFMQPPEDPHHHRDQTA